MTKLKKEELLGWLDEKVDNYNDQAYQQIKEMIEKPDMTIKFGSGNTIGISIGVGAEDLARTFHRVYEKLAPKYGYKTKRKTRKDWHRLPENNKKLMIAVAWVILNKYPKKPQVTEEWIEEKARELWEKGVLYRKDAENQAVISLGWAKDFIRSLVEGVHV